MANYDDSLSPKKKKENEGNLVITIFFLFVIVTLGTLAFIAVGRELT